MRRTFSIFTITILVLAAGLAGCGSKSSSSSTAASSATTQSPTPAPLTGNVSDHGTKVASGTQEMELDDNYFEPTYLKVTPSQVITLELKNTGKMPHTFTSAALNVDAKLAPGATQTVTVTAPAASGVTEFDCTYHTKLGMRGALIVG